MYHKLASHNLASFMRTLVLWVQRNAGCI